MVEARLFDFAEAKIIATKYIEWAEYSKYFRRMLHHVDSRHDYIFDVLKHDVLAGDICERKPNPNDLKFD